MNRRNFLSKSGAGLGLISSGIIAGGCDSYNSKEEKNSQRVHPLQGLNRENLKISDLKVTLFSAPIPDAEQWYLDWVPERYRAWKTDSVLIEVFTDVGIKGIGGCTQYGGPDKIKAYAENVIKPAIVGQNPFDIELLTSGVTRRGEKVAWAGVDMALWDIIGKVVEKPVYQMLSIDKEPPDKVPVYASAGEMYDGDVWPDNLIAEAKKLREKGFKAYKFRPGTHWSVSGMTMSRYIDGVWKIREAMGEDFGLIQECNAQFSLEQTMQFIPEAEKMNLLWIEDPTFRFGDEARQNYALIKKKLDKVLLSYGGDTMDNRFQYKEWIDAQAMDIVQPDAGVMGLTEAWYVSRMAHLQNQVCAPHNWHGALLTMGNAAMAASIPNLIMLEINQTYNPLRDELLKTPFRIEDGYFHLPQGHGFGVEVIDDAADKFPYMEGRYDKPRPS